MYFLKFCAFFWLCKNLSSVLRADVGIRPYGVALGECEVVGANCVRPRTVEDARPYGVALGECEVCRDDHWSSVYHRLRRCGTSQAPSPTDPIQPRCGIVGQSLGPAALQRMTAGVNPRPTNSTEVGRKT